LSGGLVATAILLRPFAILLRLAALIAVAILKLPLARGFATAAILLSLAAPIAVAILKLALARGFATATILLRCTALVPRGRIVPRATLILL
jgi:predicted membrane-bound spermidine synthase